MVPVGTADLILKKNEILLEDLKLIGKDKKVCDFGCGSGKILRKVKPFARRNRNRNEKTLDDLKNNVECIQNFQEKHKMYFDTILYFMF